MAHRHVVEGRQRIRKQVCLINGLHRNGSDRLLPAAEGLLALLLMVQRAFEDHLASFTRRAERP
jgi:hypothetical protein